MMRMKSIALIATAVCLSCFGRDMAINNGKLTSAMNANGFAITNVPNPVAQGDAANKGYVDSISGMTPQAVTNIAGRVTSNVVTKAYVEGLGIEAGISANTATNIAGTVVTNCVPSWARETNPPSTGVTNVLVDGTSVVSSGVANVSLSGKQNTLKIKSGMSAWNTTYTDMTVPGYHIASFGVPYYGSSSIWVSDVSVTTQSGSETWSVSWFKPGTDMFESDINAIELEINPEKSESMIMGASAYASRNNISSSVSSSVDATPSSTSTNRLVTSKGVADALANLPRGTDTNAVSGIITNHVESGYLCTVAAASAMTNGMSKSSWVRGNFLPAIRTDDSPNWNVYKTGAITTQVKEYSMEGLDFTIKESEDGLPCFIFKRPLGEDPGYGRLGDFSGIFKWYYHTKDESNEIAVKGDIPTDAHIVSTVADSTSLWNQSNAKLTTRINQVAAPIATAVTSVSNRQDALEGYIAGQRVRVSVTNYYGNTSGELPRLRIEEFVTATNVVGGVATETNYWQTVWDEQNKYSTFLAESKAAIAAMTNDLYQTYYALLMERLNTKAPRAWGSLTSAGAAAPAGSVWHTEQNTVFAGGTEYAHAMVGTGVIGVLTTKGAAVYTDGETGRFHFTTDDKSAYFGMNIASRYELGCATDGITVTKVGGNNLVQLTYNVTMSGKPILYYTPTLSGSITWEQITDSTGAAIPGATVAASWDQAPPAGSEICNINGGTGVSGFFKASIEYAGVSKFETNMMADLMGGIIATNQTSGQSQPVEPYISNGSVLWRVKQ